MVFHEVGKIALSFLANKTECVYTDPKQNFSCA